MNIGLSEKIRNLAKAKYVQPAVLGGQDVFSIRVKDLLNDLQAEGFPGGHTPQVCSALKTGKFLRENGLEIESIDGPPSKMSPTVVVRYRVTKHMQQSSARQLLSEEQPLAARETPEARAQRLGGKLRGLLKDELAEYGGGEAFIRWVRGYDEEDAA